MLIKNGLSKEKNKAKECRYGETMHIPLKLADLGIMDGSQG